MTNVYTYYMPIPELYDEDSQRRLIEIWARSWQKQGWNPVVLDETHARAHPRYDFFREHFWALPTTYGHEYCGACFMRWLAVSAMGGGMLTDFDVINYSFAPREADPAKMIIFCDSPSIFMGAVLGSQQHFLDFSELFAAWKPDEHDFNHSAGQHHCDDLSLLLRMECGTYPKPPWFAKAPGCSLWDNLSFRTAPLVHYGYELKARGYFPKWQWVEKLRPF